LLEVVLLEVARAVYNGLGPDDQAEVDQLLGILELNPWLDGLHKFYDQASGNDVYDNGAWSIVYRVIDAAFVEIWAIWRAMPPYTFKNRYPFPTF
jgi:hypothetical protein